MKSKLILCQKSKKVSYPSAYSAGLAKDQYRNAPTLAVYRCPDCHLYHLGNDYHREGRPIRDQ